MFSGLRRVLQRLRLEWRCCQYTMRQTCRRLLHPKPHICLAAMVTKVTPSGRLLSWKIPRGSLLAWILARAKERQITSLNKLCLVCLPMDFLQTKQWWPRASTSPPQGQDVCGWQMASPNLRPTAMRLVSSSRCSPQFEIGIASSQSPAWSD